MRWEFTPAAERALARVAHGISSGTGPDFDIGLDLLGVLFEDQEGAAFQWLIKLGCKPEGGDPLPVPPRSEDSGESGEGSIPLGRELIRALPLAFSGILRSARQVSKEIWGDPVISSEALAIGVFQRSLRGRDWLESVGLSEEQISFSLEQGAGEKLILDETLDLDFSGTPAGLIRLVDAVGNRLREGLRVLEDHYRFVQENPWLVGRLKKMRHEIDGICTRVPGSELSLSARDVQGDSGAGLRTGAERTREGNEGVIRANWKRVQEALRSLEEHAKVIAPGQASVLEALRYEAYTLEKRATEKPNQRLEKAVLMMLVHSGCRLGLEKTIKEATQGGVDTVQLREKNMSDRDLYAMATKVRTWTHQGDALFILNDRPEIAQLVGADGVHLGQEDLPIHLVRKSAPKDFLIGSSTHEPLDLEESQRSGSDYLGVGPVFSSKTKQFLEFSGLQYVNHAKRSARIPWFAIGGIGPENIQEVVKAGASRVAVSHALCQSEDPQGVARFLRLSLGAGPKG